MQPVVRALAIVLLGWTLGLSPEPWLAKAAASSPPVDADRLIVEVASERLPDLPPAFSSLSGRVLAPDGRTPAASILVFVDRDDHEPPADLRDVDWVFGVEPPYYAYSDADGAYSIDEIAPGRWRVTLYAQGKIVASVGRMLLGNAEDAKRDLVIPPIPCWRGVVVEHDGVTPVPNASVTFLPADLTGWEWGLGWIGQFSASADRRGEVRMYGELNDAFGAYMDLPFTWRKAPLSPGDLRLQAGRAPQVLQLPELPALDCALLSPDGPLAKQCAVSLLQLRSPTSRRYDTRTDALGRLHVVLSPADTPSPLLLVASGIGWAELDTSAKALPQELALLEGAAIGGTVIAPDGSPLGGAELSAEMMVGDTFTTTVAAGRTGSDGTFELRGLPPGFCQVDVPGYTTESPVRLLFPGDVYRATVLCTDADARIRATIPEPMYRLSGAITRSDGRPLKGVKVGVNVVEGGGWPLGTAPVSETGRFEIVGMRPGEAQLSVHYEGRLVGVVPVRMGPDSDVRCRAEIPWPRAEIGGRVLDGVSKQPVSGAMVIALPEEYGRNLQPGTYLHLLYRPGQSMLSVSGVPYAPLLPGGVLAAYPHATTGRDGAYRLRGLPEGRCSVAAISDDGRSGLMTTTVTSDSPRRSTVDIAVFRSEPVRDATPEDAGGPVDIRIMTPDGAPVSAWVLPLRRPFGSFTWEPLPGHTVRVSGGACRLEGLPLGEYRFLAQTPTGSPVPAGPLPRTPGEGRAQGVSDVVLVSAGTERTARIVLESFGTVAGHVAAADDVPVTRGWVRVRGTEQPRDGVRATHEILPLDGNAGYTALVPPGRYEAGVIVPVGSRLADLRTGEADIPPGRSSSIDITVQRMPKPEPVIVRQMAAPAAVIRPGRTVPGRAVDDATGQALAGVSVTAVDSPFEHESATVRTDDQGAFTLEGPDYSLWRPVARAPGYAPAEGGTIAPSDAGQPPLKGSEAPIELRMGRGLTIEGRVVWPDGVPASRVLVGLDLVLTDAYPLALGSPYTPSQKKATVGPDGTFRFESVAPGKCALCVYDNTVMLSKRVVVEGGHGDTISGLRLRVLRRVARIHADLRGMPRPDVVADLEVTLRREEEQNGYGARRTATGGLAFTDVPCGYYTLRVRSHHSGSELALGNASVEPDTESLVVDLSRAPWVLGRILTPEGRNVPPSYSVAYGSESGPAQGAPMTPVASDGSFVLSPPYSPMAHLLLLAGPHSVLGRWGGSTRSRVTRRARCR